VIANHRPPQPEATFIVVFRQQKQTAQFQGGHTIGAWPGGNNSQDPANGPSTPPGTSGNRRGATGNPLARAGSGNQPADGGTNPTGGSAPGAGGGPGTPTGGSSNPTGGATPSTGSNNPPSSIGMERAGRIPDEQVQAAFPMKNRGAVVQMENMENEAAA
jgi:hypothetical protein